MKIILKLYDTEEEEMLDTPSHVEEATNVLDAEGKLAIMARHYQKRVAEHSEGDRLPDDNEANRELHPVI